MAGTFSKLKQAYRLLRSVDFNQLSRVMEKVDLQALMNGFSKMDDTAEAPAKADGSNDKSQKHCGNKWCDFMSCRSGSARKIVLFNCR